MKYMLLIHQGDTPTPRDPDAWGRLSEEQQQSVYRDYQAISATSGVTPGLELAPPETATTVRVPDGKTLTTDGPFVELKEASGGSPSSARPPAPPGGIEMFLARTRLHWPLDHDPQRRSVDMTSKADFTSEEWKLVLEGPPSAGMIVITAQRGGLLRETVSMAKAYADARQHHGQSELLDEIVAAKPAIDHARYGSLEELKEHSLAHLREAAALLEGKATPQELDEYRHFILNLADKVANAHREAHGGEEPVSDAERAAIAAIAQALGVTTA
jgi:hypothetical protein